jgi:hypothetical protein
VHDASRAPSGGLRRAPRLVRVLHRRGGAYDTSSNVSDYKGDFRSWNNANYWRLSSAKGFSLDPTARAGLSCLT